MNKISQTPLVTPQDVVNANTLFFSWNLFLVQQGQFMNLEIPSPSMAPVQGEYGAIKVRRTPFTKISNFNNAALMTFFEDKENKYIHLCPVSLLKSAFNLKSATDSSLAKYAVVMTQLFVVVSSR